MKMPLRQPAIARRLRTNRTPANRGLHARDHGRPRHAPTRHAVGITALGVVIGLVAASPAPAAAASGGRMTSAAPGTNSIAIINPGNQQSRAGTQATLQIQATDSGGATMTYRATGMPPGIAIGSSNGLMGGTPDAATKTTVTVTVTDTSGASSSVSFDWTVTPAPIRVTNPGNREDTAGNPVSLQIEATDSDGSAMTYQAAGLPSGLSIASSTGLISGTPATPAHNTVEITVTDPTPSRTVVDFYWDIRAPGTIATVPAPARVLDTRNGIGAPQGAMRAGSTLPLQITGRGGVPASGVAAIIMNVTVTQPAASGWVTTWPDGTPRPNASNLNFVAGQTIPNLVIVPVGTDGKVDLYNGAGASIELIADVSGYVRGGYMPTAPGSIVPVAPARILDTRSGVGASRAEVAAGATLKVRVTGQGGIPASGVSAVVMNLTVTQPALGGWVAAWADAAPRPNVSNLNFVAKQTVPNLVVVPVSDGGNIDLYNGSKGGIQLIADVSGYVVGTGTATTTGAVVPVTPTRILDTRAGVGAPRSAVTGGTVLDVQVTGRGGVPASGVDAVIMNMTVTQPATAGWVTAWGSGMPWLGASNLNFAAGQTVCNLVVMPVDVTGRIGLHNYANGGIQLIGDVTGYILH